MRLLLSGLCGVVTCGVAVLIGEIFGLRSSWLVIVVIAPLIEEACKAIACVTARRNAIVSAPWTLAEAIAFGLGFGVLEAVLKWSPNLSAADVFLRLPTVVMHAFVALLLVAEVNKSGKHSAERGFVTALFWHALYNAYILVAVDLAFIGRIESGARLIVMAALFRFAAPMLQRSKEADT